MPDEYYAPLAEEEFLTAVNKYNADHSLDISVYKAPTDHVWIEDNNVELTIGRRVRLVSEEYFPGFDPDSRITKITRKVNLPSSMDIEISDALSRTAQEKMADSITDVRSFRTVDRSLHIIAGYNPHMGQDPADRQQSVLSPASQREFLGKNSRDRAKETIIFDKGIEAGNYVPGSQGGVIDVFRQCRAADTCRAPFVEQSQVYRWPRRRGMAHLA